MDARRKVTLKVSNQWLNDVLDRLDEYGISYDYATIFNDHFLEVRDDDIPYIQDALGDLYDTSHVMAIPDDYFIS